MPLKSFDDQQKRILRSLTNLPGYPHEISNEKDGFGNPTQVESYCDLIRKLFSMIPEGVSKSDLLN